MYTSVVLFVAPSVGPTNLVETDTQDQTVELSWTVSILDVTATHVIIDVLVVFVACRWQSAARQ